MTVAQAAARVGVVRQTGHRWENGFRDAFDRGVGQPDSAGYNTGMPSLMPAPTRLIAAQGPGAEPSERVKGRFLDEAERVRIADLYREDTPIPDIARVLGRDRTTIWRELTRNRSEDGAYRPYSADRVATARRARPKDRKLTPDSRLRTYVQAKLELRWSPAQISNRLVIDHPDEAGMRVCPETIYQQLYLQARGGLRREVAAALRTGRIRRRPSGQVRRPRFTDMPPLISDRPAEAADRAVPGHWEGDLIVGKDSGSAIATLVERTTRYLLLCHLPGSHDALTVTAAITAQMKTLPEHLRGSLTWDQGAEMAQHRAITVATDLQVYICNPASPWERGTNENTNGLLRQYFPKGTDLSVHTEADLELVAQQLNARPRKTLDWATPAERLAQLLSTH
ncbi:MAG: IS30 family transposase [Micrococcus sp.]|nr:IS30 family transposase [Micrococcus sp.]